MPAKAVKLNQAARAKLDSLVKRGALLGLKQ